MKTRLACAALLLCGCGGLTDPATRLGYQLESGASRLDAEESSSLVLGDLDPARGEECAGPYKVQLDQHGGLVIWCYDAQGNTVSSHSTSHHADHVAFARTFIFERPAGATFGVRLERSQGRAVVTAVQ